MDISSKIPAIQPSPKVKPTQKDATPAARPSAPQGDRVELSAQAKEMQAARAAIQRMPEVDLEKVRQIKDKLKAGQYRVDGRKAAAQMVTESLLGEEKK
jgi:flagellar biosynthesis anti-sigma factor FlgM